MPIRHRVREGECISSIADQYGFFRRTLEAHPENAELVARRGDLNMLVPGDEVWIPDRTLGSATVPTGARHVFRRRGVPEKLHLRFLDRKGNPRRGLHYRLTVDGQTFEAETDSEGMIRRFIPPGAQRGELQLREGDRVEVYRFSLGKLPPIDTPRGVQARLLNLGYYQGNLDDANETETRAALKRFQARNGLDASGEIDDPTRQLLKELYEARGES